MAPQTAASQVAALTAAPAETTLDRTVTLPSGATLKIAADWTVTASTDGLILEDPEKQLKIELVEVEAAAGMSAAISTAWSRRRPGFNRQELAASDSPGREGWDLFRWSRYKTSPEEARRVSAFVARKGTLAVVVLVDSPLAAVQRRSSEVGLVHDSLRPAGYVRETYRGRTPRPLDAARVAYLKTFIDRMRGAADVPGVALHLRPLVAAGAARRAGDHEAHDGIRRALPYSNPLASAAGYIGARTIKPDGELGQAYDASCATRCSARSG